MCRFPDTGQENQHHVSQLHQEPGPYAHKLDDMLDSRNSVKGLRAGEVICKFALAATAITDEWTISETYPVVEVVTAQLLRKNVPKCED